MFLLGDMCVFELKRTIKMDCREIVCEDISWTEVAQDMVHGEPL
jgi:hypothetical protein